MRRSVEIKVIIRPVVVFLVLIANTILSNQAADTLVRDGELVAHSHETQTELESHGGKVAADSLGEGRGATFSVSLPISAAHCEAPPEPEAVAPPNWLLV